MAKEQTVHTQAPVRSMLFKRKTSRITFYVCALMSAGKKDNAALQMSLFILFLPYLSVH